MSKALTVTRIVIPVVVVGVGLAVMTGLVNSKPVAEGTKQSDLGVVVDTQIVKSEKTVLSISAQGTVLAAEEVMLQAEVPGRVIAQSKNMVPGGRFKKGEMLLRVDPGEYSLRAAQSAAQVDQAKQQLAVEQSRGELAKEEWAIIGEDQGASEVGRSAALREPQKAEAEARMKAAEQDRNLALLNVGRTTLTAPFNGFVRDEHVEVGQYINPGAQLGSLVGSDVFWVRVSVPVGQLKHLKVPGFNTAAGEGSEVSVIQELGEDQVERKGRVLRLYGDLDPVGRMARVLIEVTDPLGLEVPEAERPLPLLLGAYVHVSMVGDEMIDVIEVPRHAVHAGRYVYAYDAGDLLSIREIDIAWRREKTLLVKANSVGGLKHGDEVIVSRLSGGVDGLRLRRSGEKPKASASASSKVAAPEASARP